MQMMSYLVEVGTGVNDVEQYGSWGGIVVLGVSLDLEVEQGGEKGKGEGEDQSE